MPTPIPQIHRGSGGGSDASAALQAIAMQNQQQMDKLLKTIEQLQQENAAQVAAAAQAGAGSATEVANKITRGLEIDEERNRRAQERAEDKEFSVAQQHLIAKLQKEAAREAALMNQDIRAGRENLQLATAAWKEKRDQLIQMGAAARARTAEMTAAGKFDSPEGRKELKKRIHMHDSFDRYVDNITDTRHLAAITRFHNDSIRKRILGEGPQDLSSMMAGPDPLDLPFASLSGKETRRIEEEGELSPEDQFDFWLTEGYPMEGTLFNNKPNHGLPKGYTANPVTPDVMLELLGQKDYEDNLNDRSLRQEHFRQRVAIQLKTHDHLMDQRDIWSNLNKINNTAAPGAIEAALNEWLADTNSAKFQGAPDRQIFFNALKHMAGGGKTGEEVVIIAAEIFDGKREPASAEEFGVVMMMESMSFNLRNHLRDGLVSGSDGNFAQQYMEQLTAQMGEENVARAFGIQDGDPVEWLKRANGAMQSLTNGLLNFSERFNVGMKSQSLLTQFRKAYATSSRLLDIWSVQMGKGQEGDDHRMRQIMSRADIQAGLKERIFGTEDTPGASLSELEGEGKDVDIPFGPFDALTTLMADLPPDARNGFSALIANRLDPVTTPDLQAYINQTKVEAASSGFGKNMIELSIWGGETERKKRAAARPSVGESIQEEGIVGGLVEQFPAMMSTGVQMGMGAVRGVLTKAAELGTGKATGDKMRQALEGTATVRPEVIRTFGQGFEQEERLGGTRNP